MTVSEIEIDDFSNIKTLDVTQYRLDLKNEIRRKMRIAVIGLGATGSAFILLLAQFLNYQRDVIVDLYDMDRISVHNNKVSMYGFTDQMNVDWDSEKVITARNFIYKLCNLQRLTSNGNQINAYCQEVNQSVLNTRYTENNPVDVIFVFTDNNESRHEIAQYHLDNPDVLIIDTRIGTYDQYEVYLSRNPETYQKTIYYEKDGSIMHIDGNRICLDDRMSFSIAMSASALAMNMFIQYGKEQIKDDFKHIMIGRDYLGVVKYD